MNHNHFHVITARTEQAYTAAQDWIANECSVLEQRFKTAALSVAVNSKHFAVCQLIKAAQLNQHYQLTAKASKLWTRKGAIAQSAMDKVFTLNR